MENGFNPDKEQITKKVEENKYEFGRNAPTVDAYTNDEYVTESAPRLSTSTSYNSNLNAGTTATEQDQLSALNQASTPATYQASTTPTPQSNIGSAYKGDSTNPTNQDQNEEYAEEVAPKIVDFNRSDDETANSYANDQSEEYAAEVAPNVIDFNRNDNDNRSNVNNERDTMVDTVTSGRGIGGLALALSILSLFVLPIVLGAAGIIIGFIARRRGATTLGAWAIGIGVISIIVGLFILPFF